MPAVTNLREAGRVAEAAPGTRRREITIISKGWGSSGYYSREMLARDGAAVFPSGTQMYIDHPSRSEEADRPERSVKDLAAAIVSTPVMKGDALVAEADVFPHWESFIDSVAPHIGLSIRACGESEMGEAEGRRGPIITSLTEGISVDFVTLPGRGGKVGGMAEAQVVELFESTRAQPVSEQLSSALGDELRDAGHARFGSDETYVYVDNYDIDQQWVIFCISPRGGDERLVRIGYERDKDGEVTLSGGEQSVERVTSYVAVGRSEESAAALKEARNAGNWFEARIHQSFTDIADQMFGNGYLTREERIALSNAIGDALQAFNQSVEENAPGLYARDPYTCPEESDVQVNETAGDGPTTKEVGMPDDKRLSELEESVRQLQEKFEESEQQREAEKTRADRAEEALLESKADRIVREATHEVDGKEVSVFEGLRERGIERAVEAAKSGTLPLAEDGKLDESALRERAVKAAKEERDYLSEAGVSTAGRVSGLGGGSTPLSESGDAAKDEAALVESFKRLGMSDDQAKLAATGR